MTRIAVVDYGAGNLVSIDQALRAAGAEVVVARRPADLAGADGLVVPGVGAAGPAMARLARGRLVEPIRAWIAAGKPYLGICLGMQLLFEGSDEDGARTLAILRGRTEQLRGAPRLPHIGWNAVRRVREHPLFSGIAPDAPFYFVHSYAPRPAGPDAGAVTLAVTDHGPEFVSAVAHELTAGVQFHPERSGRDGLRLLANFVAIAGSATVESIEPGGAAVGPTMPATTPAGTAGAGPRSRARAGAGAGARAGAAPGTG